MKNIFRHLTHKKASTSGITTSDWMTVYNTIHREYVATEAAHKRPTEYMRGLAFALEVIDSIRPYDITKEAK